MGYSHSKKPDKVLDWTEIIFETYKHTTTQL